MKHEQFSLSQLGAHLNFLRSESEEGAEIAEELTDDIVSTFTTESGLKVLMLFEKSVLLSGAKNGAPDSALREMNAVRNFVLEIRRIVANGRQR
jgi:hypothetical protein